MASTRNKNTPGNYCLEQREYKNSEQYTLYANSQYGAAYNTRLPGDGLMLLKFRGTSCHIMQPTRSRFYLELIQPI